MGDKAYTKVRVVGCSADSIESAIEAGVARAGGKKSGRSWFELVSRGALVDGKVAEWQATIDVALKSD